MSPGLMHSISSTLCAIVSLGSPGERCLSFMPDFPEERYLPVAE